MEEYEYEEENLDDFMINASSIISEENNPEKETMIESLKQHLMSIFNNQSEMQNFFNTLNSVIFNHNSNKIIHKQVFKLYPIVFSFNPNASFYYSDYFLSSINQSANEENREFFAYLSVIFSEVILAFFSDEKGNKNLVQKNYLLDNNKKYKLYEKLLNFCNEKMKINKKTEQSFGCLLLTELIEKCPLVKEEKILDNLFKKISSYLEDKWFICKLDLLNCTISLIFTAETRFKPYANICLFRVLDYLTDSEWMKRKLAINIVYTLVFYCKEEIMAVKNNIVEFLYTLKDDPVQEVREVCIQTLRFIEESEALENEKDNSQRAEPDYPKKEKNLNQKQNINENLKENKNVNQNTKKNLNKMPGSKSKDNINLRRNNDVNYNNKTEDNTNNTNLTLKDDDNSKTMSNFDNYNSRSQYKIIDKQKYNEDYLRRQLLKEKRFLERQGRELDDLAKKNKLNYNNNQNQPKSYKPKKKNTNISKSNKENSYVQSSKQKGNVNNENKKNDTIKKDNSPENQNEINENGNENYNNNYNDNYNNNYNDNYNDNKDNDNYNYNNNENNNANNNDNYDDNKDNNNYNNYNNNDKNNDNYNDNTNENYNDNNDKNNENNNENTNENYNNNNDNYNDNNENYNDNNDNYNDNNDNYNENNNNKVYDTANDNFNNDNDNDNDNNDNINAIDNNDKNDNNVNENNNNDNMNDNNNNNNNYNVNNNISNNENVNNYNNNINNGPYQNTVNGIFQQLKTIQEGQTQFMAMINELQKTIDDNYKELNERISALEDHFSVNHI